MTTGSTEVGEDEFGGNLFDEVDFSHPDEVTTEPSTVDIDPAEAVRARNQALRQQSNRAHSLPETNMTNGHRPPQHINQPQRPPHTNGQPNNTARRPEQNGHMPPPNNINTNQHSNARPAPTSGGQPNAAAIAARNQTLPPTNGDYLTPPDMPGAAQPVAQPTVAGQEVPYDAPVGFVTGRAAKEGTAQPFNPHADSPSIRRTAGVNAGKSEPIRRSVIEAPTAANNAVPPIAPPSGPPNVPANGASNGTAYARPNFVNPAADANRRIGMPGGMQSPMSNRGAYKPPAMKRPAPPDTPSRLSLIHI